MLRLDLMRLENGARFQQLCTRLVSRAFPGALGINVASWDGGRDIVWTTRLEHGVVVHDAVWQAKFTSRLDRTAQRSIEESITSLKSLEGVVAGRWILCLPVDPTGRFLDWLIRIVPPSWHPEVWGKGKLLEMLEANPDIVETFFYADYEELRQYFATEKLELVRFLLDPECQWGQEDPKVQCFHALGNDESPDLVFDVIVRNSGRVDAALLALEAHVFDRVIIPHGFPGDGLLFPQITYSVSVHHGQPGSYRSHCDTPLLIKKESVERFKIRLTDTGYAWGGSVVVTLDYGEGKQLRLPAIRLYT